MKIYADGSGSGRIALCISRPGQPDEPKYSGLEVRSHNEAEWAALLFALIHVDTYDPVDIYMDSQLVVRQFNGVYRMKATHLRRYLEEAKEMIREKGLNVTVHWIRRENNRAGWLLE